MYSICECIQTCHDFVDHTFVQFDLLFYSHQSPVRRSEEPVSEHESSPPASNLLPSQIRQQQSQHHQQHQSSRQHDGQQQQQQQRSGTTLQQQMNPLIAGPNISSQQSRQVKQANIRYAANRAVKVMPSDPYHKWNVGNSTE